MMEEDQNRHQQDKIVWIRADGNEEIASGHLMRTLSIAGELQQMGAAVTYLVADETSFAMLRRFDAEVPAIILGVPYGMPKRELPLLEGLYLETSPAKRPDWILVDSYAVTGEWLGALRQIGRVRIAFLDDERAFAAPADLVINYDPVTPEMELFYRSCRPFMSVSDQINPVNSAGSVNQTDSFHERQCLLGPAYAPLRSQFRGLVPCVKRVFRDGICRILISTGGTDPYDMAGRLTGILNAMSRLPERENAEQNSRWNSESASGQYIDTNSKSSSERSSEPALRLIFEPVYMAPGHPRVEEPARLMQECDLAISAAGTTLYELCAAGVPTLAYAMADNQVIFANAMQGAGAVSYLGDIRDRKTVANIMSFVTEWVWQRCNGIAGYELREEESNRMHALTDGSGSRRIAAAMMRE